MHCPGCRFRVAPPQRRQARHIFRNRNHQKIPVLRTSPTKPEKLCSFVLCCSINESKNCGILRRLNPSYRAVAVRVEFSFALFSPTYGQSLTGCVHSRLRPGALRTGRLQMNAAIPYGCFAGKKPDFNVQADIFQPVDWNSGSFHQTK